MLGIEIWADKEPIRVSIRNGSNVIENVTRVTGEKDLEVFENQRQAEIFAEGVALGLKLARELMDNELQSKFRGMSNGMKETIHT